MRRSVCTTILALLAACLPSVRAAAADAPSDRMVVLLSIDGLAGFYLDDAKADMPNLRKLAASGIRAASMRTSTPTVTWPTHTSLVTGVHPAKHGVVGNNYFDRTTLKPVTLITDPVYDKAEIVKVPTIYDVAKHAGFKTAGIIWPATRNAQTLDWQVPDVATNALYQKYSTASLLADAKAAGIPYERYEEHAKAGNYEQRDAINFALFKLILEKHRPNFAMMHLIDVDHAQHVKGPETPEAYAAIKRADEQVGELWALMNKVAPGKATLVVVSDHGFNPIRQAILPNVILKNAGLVEVKGTKVVGGSVRIETQGGCCFVYVIEGGDATAAKVKEAFKNVEGVEKVVTKDGFAEYGVADPKVDPKAPDLLLFAASGYSFGNTSAGELPVTAKSAELKGTHGHDANNPRLHATFVAAGVGVPEGKKLGVISNVDVAPTLATLLGVTMKDVDGKSLLAAP